MSNKALTRQDLEHPRIAACHRRIVAYCPESVFATKLCEHWGNDLAAHDTFEALFVELAIDSQNDTQSITALKLLNAAGYGKSNSDLQLDLVYNPSGAFLPGDEKTLENDFKKALKLDFEIDFNQLFAITNLPISRFLDYLIASENYED